MEDSSDKKDQSGKDIFKKLNIKKAKKSPNKPSRISEQKKEVSPVEAKVNYSHLPEGHYELVATCMQNLEDQLEQELIDIGANRIRKQKRAIQFSGDLKLLYKANIWLRTALKILKPIYHFKATGPDSLYEEALKLPWESLFPSDKSFSIDFSVHSEDFTHSQFAALKLKDAIVDRFRKVGQKRPNVERDQPDLKFHLHIQGNQVNISIDSSGDPLFKRGYRQERHFAPINECLAAGLILKTGWKGECDFLDPMTGSGTIAIEAALLACNVPPNFARTHFAFENWSDYDQALLSEVLNEAQAAYKPLQVNIFSREVQSNNIRATRVNINAANMRKSINLEQEDFFMAKAPSDSGIIVMNPPYGERLELREGLPDFYSKIGSTLKHEYTNWQAWIISSDFTSFENLGLKPSKKIPVMNGKLECQFRRYDIFEGKLKEEKSRTSKRKETE